MAVVGLVGAALSGIFGAWDYAPLVGWDAAAATFLVWVWVAVTGMSPEQTALHARRQDPNPAATDALTVAAGVASLAAVGVVLVAASSAHGSREWALAGLAVGSVALSWALVHTLFTLRYARLYHSGGGGVDFNQDDPPRYVDFAYVAFTIGMTFQVSDTDLKTSAIRATALRQALVSYLFGAVILATTVNFIVTLAGTH
jgi:uncharacterized membrane protein